MLHFLIGFFLGIAIGVYCHKAYIYFRRLKFRQTVFGNHTKPVMFGRGEESEEDFFKKVLEEAKRMDQERKSKGDIYH